MMMLFSTHTHTYFLHNYWLTRSRIYWQYICIYKFMLLCKHYAYMWTNWYNEVYTSDDNAVLNCFSFLFCQHVKKNEHDDQKRSAASAQCKVLMLNQLVCLQMGRLLESERLNETINRASALYIHISVYLYIYIHTHTAVFMRVTHMMMPHIKYELGACANSCCYIECFSVREEFIPYDG